MASLNLETLFGGDAHAFNNSENPGYPFVSMNGSGVYVDQSKVFYSIGRDVPLGCGRRSSVPWQAETLTAAVELALNFIHLEQCRGVTNKN